MTNHAAASAQPSVLYSAGSRAYSLALRSVHETKDHLLLICISLLDALDRLQERLHLPTALVKDIKRRLAKLVDRSRPLPWATRAQCEAVSDAIAESDMWNVAKPDEVQGLVHWLLAVTTSVNQLVCVGTRSVCRGILIVIMSLPGVSTACTLFFRIVQLVEDTLGWAAGADARDGAVVMDAMSGNGTLRSSPSSANYMGDPSLTAVVLEYREKECMVPMNINRRIQRVMHFQIPLRSFEATVRLPPGHFTANQRHHQNISTDVTTTRDSASYVSSASPRSIPVSPIARKRVQLAFSNFSDDVLYQARDRLRQERAATLTGERGLTIPRFNVHDCNEEIYLSCGKHCATKIASGMYRSVRATVSIPRNRYMYFEMTLKQQKSPFRMPGPSNRFMETSARGTAFGSGKQAAGGEPSVCIGLSTRAMPLYTLVGASQYSIGFYSVGHVLIGSERRSFVSVDLGYGYDTTVGVLVKVVDRAELEREGRVGADVGNDPALAGSSAYALVRFSVDGVALRDEAHNVMVFTLPFPSNSELFPTLTLHSQDVQVLSRLSAADIVALNVDDFELPAGDTTPEIWCLDGLQLGIPC
uniref:SPRY domain-containing protein n=1 Tax=Globisporangium ultimum (strain ATCC 200006 / CBS 805.95 / DAOM BR144) TaxID=431595 RepID=K3WRX1_GLOUD